MSHTYAQNTIHLVFSTKDRRKLISKEFQPRLWAYAAGICKNEGMFVHAVSGMDDHAHLLVRIPPSLSLAKAVATIKSNSSRWANEQGEKLAWQQGYAALSVVLLTFPQSRDTFRIRNRITKRWTSTPNSLPS